MVQNVSAQEATSAVAGSVSVVGPDGSAVVIPGVTVTLACAGGEPKVEVSDDTGAFRFSDLVVGPGTCSVAADLQGFKSASVAVALRRAETTMVTLQLGLDTLQEDVTVNARVDVADEGSAGARVDRLNATLVQMAPVHSDRFQDALPLIPGVVRGPDGLLNVNGTRSNQIGLIFNNANGTDPVTGEDAIELPIDAVSSVQVRGAAYAPEFGLSAGAITTVETQKAGDAWRVM